MATHFISGTIASTVTLGAGNYLSPLTITESGSVAPAAAGATGIYVPAGYLGASILNHGAVSGAGYAGFGIDLQASTHLANTGTILAGAGGYYGGNGGIGVELAAGGTVDNSGLISGGGGGGSAYSEAAGEGGVGVVISGGGTLSNSGTVFGGGGGTSFRGGSAPGGDGVDLSGGGGVLQNSGIIAAGFGYVGGFGVNAAGGGTLFNVGQIQGGGALYSSAGSTGAGVYLNDGTLTNKGQIIGGGDISGRDPSGAGVVLDGTATMTNDGLVAGGTSSYTKYGFGSGGGNGVIVSSGARLLNDGSISGGAGGAAYGARSNPGGAGIVVSQGGRVANDGTVTGGGGGGQYGDGGSGGAGVSMDGGTLTNAGMIIGGGEAEYYYGAVGVSMDGGRLTNAGTIIGGAGVYRGGGVGVYVDGGTLINAGTIIGGAGVRGQAGAVVFGGLGGTLVIDPGAVFEGNVAAASGAATEIRLAGTTLGTLSGIGTQFSGFSRIAVAPGADWVLTGTSPITVLFTDNGTLDMAGTADVASGGTLAVLDAGKAQIAGLTLQGGTFADLGMGATVIGTAASGSIAGSTVIDAGGTIVGFGTIGGHIVDDGAIVAQGGTLVLGNVVSGAGVATLDSGSTLQVNATLGVASLSFGTGSSETLLIEQGASTTAPISGFGSGDGIDVLGINANGLSFLAGTLSLQENGTTVDQLLFKGNYTAANFSLAADPRGGTDIGYVPGASAAADQVGTSPAYVGSESPPLIPLSSG